MSCYRHDEGNRTKVGFDVYIWIWLVQAFVIMRVLVVGGDMDEYVDYDTQFAAER